MDHAADSPVREQIRIATNRRSEVRIRLVIQAKVTLVIRAVHRLTQRTQHHGLDQMEIRTVLDACQQRLVILRRRTVFALVQRQTQLAEEGPEFFQTLWRRTIVHTVQGWNFVLFQEFSRGHVGRQHAFLDQLVRIVARGRPDFGDFALSTEDDPGFLSFKINRATGMTSAQQHFVQRIKLLQVRHDAGVFATQFLGFSRFWLLQDRADLVVGQAGMGVNDCLVELVISHLAGFGQGHFTDHGQAIDVRIQRAQAVGQLLGQHRNHALGEVHRVATHLRFSVQRRTDFDVTRYVGDGDVQLPATGKQTQLAGLGFAENRIVEVASIFAIDGHERQMTQIDAVFLVFLLHFRLELGSFLEHRFRPDVRNIVGAQGNVDFHAGRHVIAHDFDHIALRLEARRRPVSNLHLDELTDLGAGVAARGNQDFLLDLRIVGHDKTDAALFEVATHDGFVRTGDHFDDHAFATTPTIKTGNPRQSTIAVEHQTHLRRAHEQVIGAVIRDEEAETVTVAGNPPQDQVELVHGGIGAPAGVYQLSIALHCAQAATQGFELVFSCQTKLFHQLLATRRRPSIGKVLQNQLTAGDRVFVFFRFTSGLGIEGLPIGH